MDHHETLSLQQLLGVLRRRRWVILYTAAFAVVAAVVLSLRTTNEYQATVNLLVGRARFVPIAGLSGTEQTLTASTASKLVRTHGIAERVRRSLRSDLSTDALLSRVSTSSDSQDGFVAITARGDNGVEAAQVANAFANAFLATRAEKPYVRLRKAVRAVERQLATLPGKGPEYDALKAQLTLLRTSAALPSADAEIVDPARPPHSASAPQPVRDGFIGLGLGLLLGLAVAFALEAFDPRVKGWEELQRLVSAPQLAGIPESIFARGLRPRVRKEPRVLAAARKHFEPFERLRTSLLVFNAERELRTVIVTSPQDEREGKTTVASNLAVSLARTGLKVCVVDADLRRPRIARHFGLDGGAPGLADVIQGAPLKSALRRFPIPDPPAFVSGNGPGPQRSVEVTVLASGGKSENPAELLASEEMQKVLDELEREHDLVILDCPPLLAASDAMPLLARACGTLLVVRLFHTPRKAAVRAARVIDRARGGLLGVVGTGVPEREVREEGYGPWPVAHSQPSRVS